MFTLAHLSDPHLSPLPEPRPVELLGKRLVGYVNWKLRRRRHHDAAALAEIEKDLHAQNPEHIAVLGDLVNICLPDEFPRAAALLARLGTPHDVTLVPGNHDAYVRSEARTYLKSWGSYVQGDEPPASEAERFPFVRRRGPIALIGLCTGHPTLPFLATGTLGKAQLDRLAALLPAIESEGLFRIVLIHHPPAGTRARHKILTDAAAFRAVIAKHGAELILHGHDHKRSRLAIPGPHGDVPLIGVPSASAPAKDEQPAAWNFYRIEGKPGAWSCDMEMRGLYPSGTVSTIMKARLIG
jgi:3',5'-cyclic AMP phosphodiesterase CpdA